MEATSNPIVENMVDTIKSVNNDRLVLERQRQLERYQYGVQEDRRIWFAEGRAEGEARGRAEGEARGEVRGRNSILAKLREKGLISEKEIQELLNLDDLPQ